MGVVELEDPKYGKSVRPSSTLVKSEEEDIEGINMNSDVSEKEYSIEELFASTEVPAWWKQITFRGILASVLLGVLFSIITLKLSLTTGVIPSLNISAGLLAFFLIKSYTRILSKFNIPHLQFTRQENTVIQTCVVACYGLAFSGGFGSYLTGLDSKTYHLVNDKGGSGHDSTSDVKNPHLGWIIAFMFSVGFLGLLAVVPLRKVMIIDYKLTYPSGTATAVLINSFHTPRGYKQAVKQVLCMGKYLFFSFFFSMFKWFFSGMNDGCGFDMFPTFGLKAYSNTFYFDFSMTYVGAGMICPHLINISLLLGGILSYGLMWPLIEKKAGDWYPLDARGSNLRGLYGYKVFVAIAIILGDGLYNFVKISSLTLWSLCKSRNKQVSVKSEDEAASIDDQRRTSIFMKDRIPLKVAATCYVLLAVVSTIVIPHLFPPVKWYYIFISYIFAPILGFCNAYGCGLTDWSLASTYGKLGLFIFSAWAGSHGGVLVGLVSCGVMMVIVACSADLMQDFKTGYLTLSSPRSMFASQVIGTFMGCIIAPLTFWLFWNAFDIGDPDGEYKAPYAVIYREMAVIGVQGFGALPKHCLQLCYGFFILAVVINILREPLVAKHAGYGRWASYIPVPMAMAVPFYIGAYFTIDMFVGTVIVFIWQKLNLKKSKLLVPAVASGLICGDGIWTLISAILALAKRQAPICMTFLPSKIVDSLNLPSY
ncbi:hypothetical protein KP509_16G047800 [Ceratopteris richardii]|uniref:Uncharacterized protein n=1 Tax=Ceratopteris richardii TaxID=49495 RepID=A0A8T2T2R0_CERRI|nr:hypothetical protein KP509_16G047800 [Ceratopteris richardii]